MEKLRNFYRKYLKNYLVLLFVIAVGIDLVIETLARHSLIQSMAFLFGHPLVSISNVLLIFADHFPVHVIPPANFRSGSAGNDPDGSWYRQWCDPFQPDDAVYR